MFQREVKLVRLTVLSHLFHLYIKLKISDILKLSIEMNTISQFYKFVTVQYIKDDGSLSSYAINIDQHSDGTLIVLNILTCLVSNKSTVFWIEEQYEIL